jgi:hypothetical protein
MGMGYFQPCRNLRVDIQGMFVRVVLVRYVKSVGEAKRGFKRCFQKRPLVVVVKYVSFFIQDNRQVHEDAARWFGFLPCHSFTVPSTDAESSRC